jgi:mono/diheme cytochrome c family protein
MADSTRPSGSVTGVRSARAAWRAVTATACALALLVAGCVQSPSRADEGTPSIDAPVAPPAAASPYGGALPGEQTYRETCVACHGEDGKGGQGGGMPLTAVPNVDFIIETVSYGRNNMPSFAGALTTEQIRAVSAYVLALIKQ